MTIKSTKPYLGYIAVFGSLTMWGLSFPLAKHALQFVDMWALLFYRLLFGALAALPFLYCRYQPIKRHHLSTVAVWALALIPVCLMLQFASLQYTSASIASLAIGFEFPFVIMWLYLLHKKRPNRLAFYIIALGAVGLALIVGEFKVDSTIGLLFILAGGVAFSLGSVLSDQVAQHYDPIFTSAIGMVIGAVVLFFPWLAFGTVPTVDIPLSVIGIALFLGVFNSFLNTFLWVYGCRVITSTRATQMIMVEPLVGAVVSILWLGEYWYWGTVVGAVMVMGSMAMDSRLATD